MVNKKIGDIVSMSRTKKLLIVLIILLLIPVFIFIAYNLLIVNPAKKEMKSISLQFLDINKFHIKNEYLDNDKLLIEGNQNVLVQNFEKNLKKVMISSAPQYKTRVNNYNLYLKEYQGKPYLFVDKIIKFKKVTNFKYNSNSADIEMTFTTIEVTELSESKYEEVCSFHFEKVDGKWMIQEYYENYTDI